MVKKAISLVVAIILFITLGVKDSLAVNYDMQSPANWNIRIDGALANDSIGVNLARYVDLNGNGKPDLVFAANSSYNSRAFSGSVYIIYDSLLSSYTGTGNTIDLSNSSNYSVRIDGDTASDNLGWYGISFGDLDNDSRLDLVLSAKDASFNSRSLSGSVYVIYNTKLQSLSGNGNNLDLATSTSYNLRFDGSTANCNFGFQSNEIYNGDFDLDGKYDLAIGSSCDFNSRANSGSLYLIYNSTFRNYLGTGNNIDLATSSNWNIRIDGAVANDRLVAFNSNNSGVAIGDLDNDGHSDLIVGADGTDYNSRSASGSIYILYNTLIDDYAGTGNTVDLSNTSKFNIRIDGAVAGNSLGAGVVEISDLDQNGTRDLLITVVLADFNSRSNSGSIYYIDYSIFGSLTGTANLIDLSTSTKYTFRIDGEVAGDSLGYNSKLSVADANNDSYLDLLIPANSADNNGRLNSGSTYLLSGALLFSSSTLGRTFDLATTTNYMSRYDGDNSFGVGGDSMGSVGLFDSNLDGMQDFVFHSAASSYNSRSFSGSLWITYNFPHNITQSSATRNGSTVTIKGQVLAPNSVTSISGVEYQVGTNKESNIWTACTADDGIFNSLTENFTCNAITPDNDVTHTVFIRAYDTNNSYTAKSYYLTYSEQNRYSLVADYLKNAAKPMSVFERSNIITMVNSNTFKYDTYLDIAETPKVGSFKLPNTSYWQVGSKEEVWWKSFDNGAKILPSEVVKPFTLIFKYNQSSLEKSIPEETLKLAYSIDGKTWKIINSNLDTTKDQLVIITKQGGYYMIVGSGFTKVSTPLVKGIKTQDIENNLPEPTPSTIPQTEVKQETTTSKKHCFLFYCW